VLAEAHKTVFGATLEDKTSTGTARIVFFGLYAGIPAMVYGPQSDGHPRLRRAGETSSRYADYTGDGVVHRRVVRPSEA